MTEVLPLSAAEMPAFRVFSAEVWGTDLTPAERVERGHAPRNPYEDPSPSCATVLVDDGRVIGHIASTPSKVWCKGEERYVHWCSGFHLLPEARGKGLAKLLIRRLMEMQPLLSGVVVVDASRRAFLSNGWQFDWKIPEFVKLLDAPGFLRVFEGAGFRNVPPLLQRLLAALGPSGRGALGHVLELPHAVYQGARRLLRAKLEVEIRRVDDLGVEVDALWERSRTHLSCAQVRESAYLNYMFPASRNWLKFEVRDQQRLVAYTVVSIASLSNWNGIRGVKLASVIDMFWDPTVDGLSEALLARMESEVRGRGAHVLTYSGTCAQARRTAIRCGFVPIPGTVWYGYHSGDPTFQFAERSTDWFANRGDADAAGSLGPTGSV